LINQTWRYIPPIKASGAMQMAIDCYLLEQHRQGKHIPSLRFYTWQPAAISLGYHQKSYPPDWDKLTFQSQPLDIVRRPTGGRAVLHQGDLTYAIITSIPPGKRLEVYKQICEFLISGWRSLGVNLDYGNATKEYMDHSNCFATATGSDLVTPPELYLQVFKTSLAENLNEKFPNQKNQSISNYAEKSRAKIIQNLIVAAKATFKIDIVNKPLSNEEWQYIARHFSLLRY